MRTSAFLIASSILTVVLARELSQFESERNLCPKCVIGKQYLTIKGRIDAFCKCYNGVATFYQCPDGQLFNPSIVNGDWPIYILCIKNDTAVETTTFKPTPLTTTAWPATASFTTQQPINQLTATEPAIISTTVEMNERIRQITKILENDASSESFNSVKSRSGKSSNDEYLNEKSKKDSSDSINKSKGSRKYERSSGESYSKSESKYGSNGRFSDKSEYNSKSSSSSSSSIRNSISESKTIEKKEKSGGSSKDLIQTDENELPFWINRKGNVYYLRSEGQKLKL